MSEQNPYETLGVTEDASFEEIQNAKSRLSQEHQNDTKLVETIEAAYDSIIMERLRMRQEGKIKVPDRIRFPERSVEVPPAVTPLSAKASTGWLQNFLDNPSRSDVLWATGVFGGLAILTLLSQSNGSSFLPLALALGFCANLYFLNRKENRLGRAFLMSFVGLILGLLLGGVLSKFLGTPVGNGGIRPAEFAELVTFVLFWLMSCFLR
ncbi:CPP1-like family protein [Spirulina subsalsa FACHB-351]|uniref:CPP1-like family protein n=1 Tax=Spirulina subsalsa FACHB-351 TaxID=234711 RepID=A0ABT3L860_9CYAN|nr:CPP1-like family protein [Spirulina subsalsa]MCW6037683.1 CPP1-like family protein [Spirulina subsalsa FACHB-351]